MYFNVVKSKDIINSPYNARQESFADQIIRGKILDKEGNILADTEVDEEGIETRVYPYGDVFAHVVGYSSQGMSGLESVENFNLLTSNAFFLEKIMKEFREEKNVGDNVVTTLDANLQEAAYNALGNSKGAVFVMEASTGKILAMVSKPTFDPNSVAENWSFLTSDPDSSMLNRVTQGMYAPGSTFKIVTALEYMREDANYGNYSYLCEGSITYGDTTIRCFDGTVHGHQDLLASIANSCNASFANIGMNLNPKSHQKTAKELLFQSKLPSVLPYSKSQFKVEDSTPVAEKMMTAMGQGQTLVSPYHMGLITAAIANGGMLMKPYLVDEITNYTGTSITKHMPEKYGTLMSSAEASQLKTYMQAVVDQGTATLLSGASYSVAGKTGTAEYSSDESQSHSWFIGFTNVDNPELVISVVVEGADDSGIKAVPIAKSVLDAYYYN